MVCYLQPTTNKLLVVFCVYIYAGVCLSKSYLRVYVFVCVCKSKQVTFHSSSINVLRHVFFCPVRGFFKFITDGKKEEEVRRKENQNNTFEILTLIPPTRSYSPFNIRGTNL